MTAVDAWMAALSATVTIFLAAAVARRRRAVRKRARAAHLGRAENAVRLVASQRDEAVAARRQAETLMSAALQEHRSLREACIGLAKRWAAQPHERPEREDPCAFAEELRQIVDMHGEGRR